MLVGPHFTLQCWFRDTHQSCRKVVDVSAPNTNIPTLLRCANQQADCRGDGKKNVAALSNLVKRALFCSSSRLKLENQLACEKVLLRKWLWVKGSRLTLLLPNTHSAWKILSSHFVPPKEERVKAPPTPRLLALLWLELSVSALLPPAAWLAHGSQVWMIEKCCQACISLVPRLTLNSWSQCWDGGFMPPCLLSLVLRVEPKAA